MQVKIMNNRWSIVLFGLLFSGCITSSYHKSNNEYSHLKREFDTSFKSSYMIFKGVYAGKRKHHGKMHHYLQFEGLLKGKGRCLDVLISLEGKLKPAVEVGPDGRFRKTGRVLKRPGDVIILESEKRLTGKYPAYIIFQIYTSLDQKINRSFYNQKVGQVSDPAVLLKDFNYKIRKPQYPFALVHLDFSNIDKYTADALVWERDSAGKQVVSSVSVNIDKYDGALIAVEWRVRDKLLYGVRQAGYVGTVVADVITSPVQLVMLILEALAGPGVR
jgi:hypothetical protein